MSKLDLDTIESSAEQAGGLITPKEIRWLISRVKNLERLLSLSRERIRHLEGELDKTETALSGARQIIGRWKDATEDYERQLNE